MNKIRITPYRCRCTMFWCVAYPYYGETALYLDVESAIKAAHYYLEHAEVVRWWEVE